MIKRIGFCCKWLDTPDSGDKQLNGRSTTMRWLREHKGEAEQRLWDIMDHNAAAALRLVEKVGEMPTEMFFHFFKSFSDSAKCNLNIQADGQNEHHKIEAIFKAFAKAIQMAVQQDGLELPTTKGIL